MLAIPVFRARVAPVLDWCSKIIIIPEEGPDAASGRDIDVMEENIFRLMRTLREKGIKTLICGALSPEMLNYCESIGLRIIHGIAGDIEEVLQAYREQKLDQPQYWLPGCRGQRRYKGGGRCTGRGKDGITSGGESGGSGTGPARKGSRRSTAGEDDRGAGRILCLPEMRIEKTARTWNTMLAGPLSGMPQLNDQGIRCLCGYLFFRMGMPCSAIRRFRFVFLLLSDIDPVGLRHLLIIFIRRPWLRCRPMLLGTHLLGTPDRSDFDSRLINRGKYTADRRCRSS